MTYSKHNAAWGRLMRQRADLLTQHEAELACAIQRACPEMTRAAALREAARLVARGS